MADILIRGSQFGIEGEDCDYTQNLCDALKRCHAITQNHDVPTLELPPGIIRVSATCVPKGDSGGAPRIRGAGGRSFASNGTRLDWYGPAGGTVIQTEAFNCGEISGLAINGRSLAGKAINISATTYADNAPAATDGFIVSDVRLFHVRPGHAEDVCLAVGTAPEIAGGEYEVGDGTFRDVMCTAENPGSPGFSWAGLAAAGFRSESAGNCKNFTFEGIAAFETCGTAVDWARGSGYLHIAALGAADCAVVVRGGGGPLSIESGDIEAAHLHDFRLLLGTGQAGFSADIRNLECFWGTDAGVDPILFDYGGALSFERCKFGHQRAGDDWYTPFRMLHGALDPRSTFGSFSSKQNTYFGCSGPHMPLWDTSGNFIAPIPDTYAGVNPLRAKSKWDVAIPTNGHPVALEDFDLSFTRYPHLAGL